MKPEQARDVAEKLFGPGSTVTREGSWCRILNPEGVEVGKGESWKSALQMAAQPLLAAERAKQQEAEEKFKKARDEFAFFLETLFMAWKGGALEFRHAKTGELLNLAISEVPIAPPVAVPEQGELPLGVEQGPPPEQKPLVTL